MPYEECQAVLETHSQAILSQQCRTVSNQQCTTVQEQQCSVVNRQQCSTVQEQQCSTVQEEICRATSRQECNTVNEQVCETQYVCNTVQDQGCTTVQDQECQTVNEQQCSTVHNTVQGEAKAYMVHVMTAVTVLVVATTICTDETGTLTTDRMAVVRTFLCEVKRGKGTSRTSLVTSLQAQARKLPGQEVAYNSPYSSKLEERASLATQGDIGREEEQKQELKEQQRALCGRRTGEDEVGANSANGGHYANNDEHSEQAEACDAGDENAGDDGDKNAGEIEEEQDKKVQGGTASEKAMIANHANRVANAIKQE